MLNYKGNGLTIASYRVNWLAAHNLHAGNAGYAQNAVPVAATSGKPKSALVLVPCSLAWNVTVGAVARISGCAYRAVVCHCAGGTLSRIPLRLGYEPLTMCDGRDTATRRIKTIRLTTADRG